MLKIWLSGLAALLLATVAVADEDMEVVLVTGVQPGPALWKVSSGDHVLWILGEVAPQPGKVKWRSKRFEALLEDSQEALLDFSGVMWPDRLQKDAEAKIRKLPHEQSLKSFVSPELYARADA